MPDPGHDPTPLEVSIETAPPSAATELLSAWARLRATLARRRAAFVALALLTFAVVQGLAFVWPGTFAAQTALLVQKARSAPPLDTEPSRGATVLATGVTEAEVNSEIAILTSREVLAAAVAAAGLDRAPEPWYLRALGAPLRLYDHWYAAFHGVPEPTPADRAIRGLERALSVERMKESNVLVVTLKARSPEAAHRILEELVKDYLLHHIAVHGAFESPALFNDEAGLVASKLDGLEQQLLDERRKAGVVDALGERDAQLKADFALREEADSLRRRLAELNARIVVYDTEMAGTGRQAPVRGAALDELKNRELQLELDQVQVEARYSSDFPLVQENRQKLDKARAALAAERARAMEADPTMVTVAQERSNAVAERSGVRERLAVLDGQLQASRQRLLDLDRQVTDSTREQRRVRALEERYLMYLSRGEQGRIDADLDQGRVANVSVVQAPSLSPLPVSPKKTVVLVVSLLGALLVATLFCAWLELRALGAALLTALAGPAEAR